MKLLRILGLVAFVAGMVGLLGSTIARQVYASKAQLIQRVTPVDPDLAALTGETGNPVGEPQLMIINDKAAFLDGQTEGGASLVNETYLQQNNIYPLQQKTVVFVTQMGINASIASAVFGSLVLVFVKFKTKLT